ncbi:MAG: hypothetical protein WD066_06910 [Planctomycetaceae bacterium]
MIALIVAISLVVVMGTVALALDRLWLDSADVELRTASEAAALAAAAAILDDSLLETEVRWPERLEAARRRAADVAAENLVAGTPLALDTAIEGDVVFGRLVFDEAELRTRFVQADHAPTTVVVTGRRMRSRNNPVGLFLSGASGVGEADVVASAEATWDDHVLGVRALENVPVPALPLAILARDPAGARDDTWEKRIAQRGGGDRFSFDPATGQVVEQPDGIPEIILRTKTSDGDADEANVVLIDVGSGLRSDRLAEQIARGLAAEHLAGFGGELLPIKRPIRMASSSAFPESALDALGMEIGRRRIGLLYENHESSGSMGYGRVDCVGLVAGRIMALERAGAYACEIVFQPGVMSTRTAVLATEHGDAREDVPANQYVYKVRLTQ